MRSIKFRAWDIEEKRWSDLGLKSTTWTPVFSHDAIPTLDIGGWKHLVLMQFTGILDKNGREIYEGDLIKGNFRVCSGIKPFGTRGNGIYEVVWHHFKQLEPAWYAVERSRDCAEDLPNPQYRGEWESCEVIGNIYENPKLLG